MSDFRMVNRFKIIRNPFVLAGWHLHKYQFKIAGLMSLSLAAGYLVIVGTIDGQNRGNSQGFDKYKGTPITK